MRRTAWLTIFGSGLGIFGAAGLPAQSPGGHAPNPAWLKWNAQTRTVTFELIAGVPGLAKSPFNFDGYTDGELTLVVPEGATTVMNFQNDDGTPHSAQVIKAGTSIPNMAEDEPAILRAYSRAAGEGIAQFGTDVLRFQADPAGEYRIFCGVPGHGLSGMWIRFRVSPEVQEPAMFETPSGGP